MMITIELLEVMFETEREHDEARFAELFATHIAAHEQRRSSQRQQAIQSDEDRSLDKRSAW
jgi:hypothetical protein